MLDVPPVGLSHPLAQPDARPEPEVALRTGARAEPVVRLAQRDLLSRHERRRSRHPGVQVAEYPRHVDERLRDVDLGDRPPDGRRGSGVDVAPGDRRLRSQEVRATNSVGRAGGGEQSAYDVPHVDDGEIPVAARPGETEAATRLLEDGEEVAVARAVYRAGPQDGERDRVAT